MPEPPPPRVRERLRELPSVDRLATSVARAELAERRAELLAGATDDADLVARARERLRPSLRRVLNATGVVVHTNLGRAPLAASARAAVAAAAEGYSNLELDLATGERGSRHAHVETLLREVTGAEAALAVNNCAAAVLLAAAALAGPGREVVVSRGQLIEIGGGFRIPEVVAQAGARLVEVGTTNRTRLADYAAALGERTGAILRAHPSNFRTLGFTEEVEIEALCGLGVPVIDDVGSGVLADDVELLAEEPAVRRSVRAGAAVVCFSADKLLGGPQAGVLVGTHAAVEACRRHPLARAVRIDKLSLAALEATLALYRDPELARARAPGAGHARRRRPRRSKPARGGWPRAAAARSSPPPRRSAAARCRCSSCPARRWRSTSRWPQALRAGDPPLVGRIADGRLLLDVRTLTDEEADQAAAAVRAAREA